MQNYAQIGDIDHTSLHNIFIISVITNPRILQHIIYSFLYLKILVKPKLSMHGPLGHQNISFSYYSKRLLFLHYFDPERKYMHAKKRNKNEC